MVRKKKMENVLKLLVDAIPKFKLDAFLLDLVIQIPVFAHVNQNSLENIAKFVPLVIAIGIKVVQQTQFVQAIAKMEALAIHKLRLAFAKTVGLANLVILVHLLF